MTSEEAPAAGRGRNVATLVGLTIVTLLIAALGYFAFLATGREKDATQPPEAQSGHSRKETTTPSSPLPSSVAPSP